MGYGYRFKGRKLQEKLKELGIEKDAKNWADTAVLVTESGRLQLLFNFAGTRKKKTTLNAWLHQKYPSIFSVQYLPMN